MVTESAKSMPTTKMSEARLTVEFLKHALEVLAEQKDAAGPIIIDPRYLQVQVRLTENGWEMYHAVKGWIPCDEPR